MRRQPPTVTQWQRDGAVHGHTVAETLAWARDVELWEDEHAEQHALPANVVSVDAEPRWLSRLRRWFGR